MKRTIPRPPARHARLAEQAAYDAGARAVEWQQGRRHYRMVVTLPDGRTSVHTVSRKLSPAISDHQYDWTMQHIRRDQRREPP